MSVRQRTLAPTHTQRNGRSTLVATVKRKKNGQFAGSVGTGKTAVPTATNHPSRAKDDPRVPADVPPTPDLTETYVQFRNHHHRDQTPQPAWPVVQTLSNRIDAALAERQRQGQGFDNLETTLGVQSLRSDFQGAILRAAPAYWEDAPPHLVIERAMTILEQTYEREHADAQASGNSARALGLNNAMNVARRTAFTMMNDTWTGDTP